MTAVVAVTLSFGPNLHLGSWRAWLETPGGELPFGLELERAQGEVRAWLVNGSERIAIPTVRVEGAELHLGMDHYDSRIVCTIGADGQRLDGHWRKRRGPDRWENLTFHATAGAQPRFRFSTLATERPPSLPARWAVVFSSSSQPAVGVIEHVRDGHISGTFLTTLGDYRYLAGMIHGADLRLSCFDGAHAFLFHATRGRNGNLIGDFWSGSTWHETWVATPDPHAKITDAFGLTTWTARVPLDSLMFSDLDGVKRSLDDPAFRGRARVIEVFGTWCPNCRDATEYLVELDKTYRARGLRILALAFENTGDFKRDAALVRRYAQLHNATYPMLLAGTSSKSAASTAFPLLDRVRAYPTFIFIDDRGDVRAVYTGFSGPATGPAHALLRTQFEGLIEEMLRP